jgi:limonene-1,2-epoxide hydrolase
MSENQQTVLNFIQAVNEHDINGALTYLDAECFYHNILMEPVTGKEEEHHVS